MTRPATPFVGLVVVWLVVGAATVGAVAPGPAPGTDGFAPSVTASTDGSTAATAAQTNGSMTFRPGNGSSDDAVTVELRTNAGGVAGYQANVTFDPSVVRVDSVDDADWDGPVYNFDNDAGWLFLTQSRARESDEPGLATITFEVVGEVDGTIDLSFVEGDTLVNDADSEPVPVELDDGPVRTEPGELGAQDDGEGDASADDRDDAADSADGSDADAGGLPDAILVLAGVGVAVALVVGVLAGRRPS